MINTVQVNKGDVYVTDFIPGSIVKCVIAPEGCDNVGDILLVTRFKERPLIDLKTGFLWGLFIDEYRFTLISKPGSNITITPFDNL